MNRSYALRSGLLTAVVSLFLSAPASAAFTVFVSANGNNQNPCERTTPCTTLQRALNAVEPNGIIRCLDSGPYISSGFNLIVIDKGVTIDCEDVRATVLVDQNATGITVNAPATARVTLRGLNLETNPVFSNTTGIRLNSARSLTLEDCVVRDMSSSNVNFGSGIYVTPSSGATALFVRNSTISGSGSTSAAGITLKPSGDAKVHAVVTYSSIDDNRIGVLSSAGSGTVNVGISNTSISGNSQYGVFALFASNIDITKATIASNGGTGIYASSPALVRVGDSLITSNAIGVVGNVRTFGNNQITGNGTQGSPAPIAPAMAGLP